MPVQFGTAFAKSTVAAGRLDRRVSRRFLKLAHNAALLEMGRKNDAVVVSILGIAAIDESHSHVTQHCPNALRERSGPFSPNSAEAHEKYNQAWKK